MLAASVTVAGGLDEWAHFMECLRKWLVAMVAGWIDDRVVNHEVLVEQAFIDLGFEPVACDGLTGYLAVQRAPEEVSMLGRQLATRARRDEEPPDHF